MKTDFLIIGQGIAGTFLTFEMEKAGLPFMVIDDPEGGSSSKIASGIINPVTGRRIVETWMIDELLSTAVTAYREIEAVLGERFFGETSVFDFFPTAQMRLAFLERIRDGSRFLYLPANENDLQDVLNYELGYGIVKPAYLVDLAGLISAYRLWLLNAGKILEERFEAERLNVADDKVIYGDIEASRIIFCDGISGSGNSFFKNLPFAPNKGEALVVEIPGLARTSIFKKGISVVPWQHGLFWVGSSHEWNFEREGPTQIFRERTLAQLKSFCRLPFTVVDHLAGVRPATLERRPFVGFHPKYLQVGIFNGLGTKGCSLAPFLARQWVRTLAFGEPLMAEADVRRFSKVLMRDLL